MTITVSEMSPEKFRQFVRESNAIEEIFKPEDHPLFADHIVAACFAAEVAGCGNILNPQSIHQLLMRSEPEKYPGTYRFAGSDGEVAGSTLIPPYLVQVHMRDLLDEVHRGPVGNLDEWCWKMHYEFEHIHPFFDGNGRTGRIWMNAMRLVHGLPWMIVTLSERDDYFAKIRAHPARVPSVRPR